MARDTRPGLFLYRKCYTCKKVQPKITTGLKEDPRICLVCLAKWFHEQTGVAIE